MRYCTTNSKIASQLISGIHLVYNFSRNIGHLDAISGKKKQTLLYKNKRNLLYRARLRRNCWFPNVFEKVKRRGREHRSFIAKIPLKSRFSSRFCLSVSAIISSVPCHSKDFIKPCWRCMFVMLLHHVRILNPRHSHCVLIEQLRPTALG